MNSYPCTHEEVNKQQLTKEYVKFFRMDHVNQFILFNNIARY